MRLRPFFLIIACGFLALNSFSQNANKYEKYDSKLNYVSGYIIRNDSTREDGLVKDNIMNEAAKFASVTFVPKSGEKTSYFPSSIKGFGYIGHDFVSDQEYFYEVEKSGKKVSLYRRLEVNFPSPFGLDGKPTSAADHVILQTQDEIYYLKRPSEKKFRKVRKGRFVKEMSEYFLDCPYLRAKIMSKELGPKNLEKIRLRVQLDVQIV